MRNKLLTAIEKDAFKDYQVEWTFQLYSGEDGSKIEPMQLSQYETALMQAIRVDLRHPSHLPSLEIFQPHRWTQEEIEIWLEQNSENIISAQSDLEQINSVRALYKSELASFNTMRLALKGVILAKGQKKTILHSLGVLSPQMEVFKPDQLSIELKYNEIPAPPIKINGDKTTLSVKKDIQLSIIVQYTPVHSSRNETSPQCAFKLSNGDLIDIQGITQTQVTTNAKIIQTEIQGFIILTQAMLEQSTSMRLLINNEALEAQLNLFELSVNQKASDKTLCFHFVPFDKAIMIVDGNYHNIEENWQRKQQNSIQHCFYEKEIPYQLTFPIQQDGNYTNGYYFGVSQYSALEQCWKPYPNPLEINTSTKGVFLRDNSLSSLPYQRYDLRCLKRLFRQAQIKDSEDQINIILTHNIEEPQYTLVIDLGTSSLCVAVYHQVLTEPKILKLQSELSNIDSHDLIESDLNIYPAYIDFDSDQLLSDAFPIKFNESIILQNQISESTLTNIKILMLIPSLQFKTKDHEPITYDSYDVINPANQYFIKKIEAALIAIGKQYSIGKVIFSIPNLGINENTKAVYISAFNNEICKIEGYTHLKLDNETKLQQWAEVSLFSESQSVLFYYYYNALEKKKTKYYIVFDMGAGTTDLTHAEIFKEQNKTIITTKCNICLPLAGSFIDYLMASAFINYLVKKDNEYQKHEPSEFVINDRQKLKDKTLFPHEIKHYDSIFSEKLKKLIVDFKYHYKSKEEEKQIPSLLKKFGLANEFNMAVFDDLDAFYKEFENTDAYSDVGYAPLLTQITALTKGAIDNIIDVCNLRDKIKEKAVQIIVSGRTARFSLIQDILKQHYGDQLIFVSEMGEGEHEDKYAVVKGTAILADRQERYKGLLQSKLVYPKLFLYKKDDFEKNKYQFVHVFDLNQQAEYNLVDSDAGQATYSFFISYDGRSYNAETNTPDIETFINRVYVLEQFKWENTRQYPQLTFKITKDENMGVNKIHFRIYNQSQEDIIYSTQPILHEFFELGVKKGRVPWQSDNLFKQAMWPYCQNILE